MFLPIGDEPNLRGRPVVTYALIGLNVAVYVLISWPLTMRGVQPTDPGILEYLHVFSRAPEIPDRVLLSHLTAHDLFVFQHGFKPASPSLFDLFASMFLHGGWLHLAGNMLFLWIFGDNVELHVGRIGYLLIYLLTGVTAVALHALFRANSMMPMVGASGAISGVLGCYFLWFPRNQVRILVIFIFFIQVIRLPARWVLGFYLVVENLLPLLLTSGAAGVAYGAHIGGFLGGLGAAAAVTAWQRRGALAAGRRRFGGGEAVPRREGSPRAVFRQLITAGNWTAALSFYVELPARAQAQLPGEDVLALADWLVEREQVGASLAVLQRYIATHPIGEALPRAHLRAGLIHLREARLPAARQHFLAVLDLDSSSEEVAGARSGLSEVERRQRMTRRSRFH